MAQTVFKSYIDGKYTARHGMAGSPSEGLVSLVTPQVAVTAAAYKTHHCSVTGASAANPCIVSSNIATPSAPTAAAAGAGAGNVNTGNHYYFVQAADVDGKLSARSAASTVVATVSGSDGQVTVTLATLPANAVGWWVFRTVTDEASTTTAYKVFTSLQTAGAKTDNVADSTLITQGTLATTNTCSVDQKYAIGDYVYLSGITGADATYLNSKIWQITAKAAGTITLGSADTTGLTWTSGGTVDYAVPIGELPAEAVPQGTWLAGSAASNAGTTATLDIGTAADPDSWLDAQDVKTSGTGLGSLAGITNADPVAIGTKTMHFALYLETGTISSAGAWAVRLLYTTGA